MRNIWDKFWNDEDFFLRIVRGGAVAFGGFVLAGGLSDFLPRDVGAGIMGVAAMFSGNGRKR